MKKQNKKNKGFTLVELIVVIAILAILAVTAVVAIGNVSSQAKEATLLADANTVVRALNTYNSLAGTPKTNSATLTAADLKALALEKSSDLIDLNLGVDLTSDRFTEVMGKIEYSSGAWRVK